MCHDADSDSRISAWVVRAVPARGALTVVNQLTPGVHRHKPKDAVHHTCSYELRHLPRRPHEVGPTPGNTAVSTRA